MTEDFEFIGEPHPTYTGIGWAKRYMDRVAKHLHDKTDTNFCIIRSSAIYGSFDIFDYKRSHVIPSLIMRASERKPNFLVWGDGKQERDFVHADDVANGLISAIESYSVADSLNIAFGKSHTINDVVSEILDCYYNPLDSIQKNNRPYIEYDLEKPVMIEKRSININKAKSLIGYSPKWNLSDGIKETVDWYEYTRNR